MVFTTSRAVEKRKTKKGEGVGGAGLHGRATVKGSYVLGAQPKTQAAA